MPKYYSSHRESTSKWHTFDKHPVNLISKVTQIIHVKLLEAYILRLVYLIKYTNNCNPLIALGEMSIVSLSKLRKWCRS